ncbi:MAG: hemerythrin domain-containing protein [Azoarcus sp.]|jgi:hemerythrin-like metal-binding protein|nr:hemerythrin domain-containing protein [Azoarcus sp.]
MEMKWGERYALGIARMDETHREFIDFCNALTAAWPKNEHAPSETSAASNGMPQDFLGQFDAFIEHTAAHFNQENRWMEAVNFPGCHREEHDRVLNVVQEVRKRIEKGDFFLGRRLLEELHPWFDNHIDTMDTALAFYLKEIGFDTEAGTLPESRTETPLTSAHNACDCAVPQTAKTP